MLLIRRTSLKKNTDTENDVVVNSSQSAFNHQLIVSVIQSVLFGLSWGIGLLMAEDTHSSKIIHNLFTSLFVILTSLHGLSIFILYCLCSKDVWNFVKRMCSDIKGNQFHLLTFAHTKGESSNSSPLKYPNHYLETKLYNSNLSLFHENTGKFCKYYNNFYVLILDQLSLQPLVKFAIPASEFELHEVVGQGLTCIVCINCNVL